MKVRNDGFRFLDELGVPLAVWLEWRAETEVAADLEAFVEDALNAGWSEHKVQTTLEAAFKEGTMFPLCLVSKAPATTVRFER